MCPVTAGSPLPSEKCSGCTRRTLYRLLHCDHTVDQSLTCSKVTPQATTVSEGLKGQASASVCGQSLELQILLLRLVKHCTNLVSRCLPRRLVSFPLLLSFTRLEGLLLSFFQSRSASLDTTSPILHGYRCLSLRPQCHCQLTTRRGVKSRRVLWFLPHGQVRAHPRSTPKLLSLLIVVLHPPVPVLSPAKTASDRFRLLCCSTQPCSSMSSRCRGMLLRWGRGHELQSSDLRRAAPKSPSNCRKGDS